MPVLSCGLLCSGVIFQVKFFLSKLAFAFFLLFFCRFLFSEEAELGPSAVISSTALF